MLLVLELSGEAEAVGDAQIERKGFILRDWGWKGPMIGICKIQAQGNRI